MNENRCAHALARTSKDVEAAIATMAPEGSILKLNTADIQKEMLVNTSHPFNDYPHLSTYSSDAAPAATDPRQLSRVAYGT